MFKKIIILFILLFNFNKAYSENICSKEGFLIGFGFEHHGSQDSKYLESVTDQWLRASFKVPIMGIKCGMFTASTNNLFNLNKGYDITIDNNGNKLIYHTKSIRNVTVGVNLLNKPIKIFDKDILFSFGVSYSPSIKIYNGDIKTLDYNAGHLTFSFTNINKQMLYITYTDRRFTSEPNKVDSTLTLGIVIKTLKIF